MHLFCWGVHISIAWHSCTADYVTLCSGSQSGFIKLFPLFHTDINECIEYEDYENPYTTNDVQVEHNHLCHAKATCFNTIGSFHCKCKLGYHGDGKLCLSNKYRMVAALFRSKWQRAKLKGRIHEKSFLLFFFSLKVAWEMVTVVVHRRFLVNVQVKLSFLMIYFVRSQRFRFLKIAIWKRTQKSSFFRFMKSKQPY